MTQEKVGRSGCLGEYPPEYITSTSSSPPNIKLSQQSHVGSVEISAEIRLSDRAKITFLRPARYFLFLSRKPFTAVKFHTLLSLITSHVRHGSGSCCALFGHEEEWCVILVFVPASHLDSSDPYSISRQKLASAQKAVPP